jgi:hypothetical protein
VAANFATQDQFMKKIVLVIIALVSVSAAIAQKTKTKKDWSKLKSRPGDHIMVQLTSDHWMGEPDSVKSHISGLARGANVYIMLDKPFAGNPHISAAFGVGVGTSNIYFKNMNVDIKSVSTTYLPFQNLDSSNHFKKYKLTTAYLEVPVEIRYSSDPENDGKSIKAAIGVKVGTLLNVHTKGKSPEDKNNASINSYTEKESSKRFFNSTRLAATARIGYGHFSLFGSYQINSLFKDGVAADTKLIQIGLCLSGL